MIKRPADILILLLTATAFSESVVTLSMTADGNRIETSTTECYYRNTLPAFAELAADWLVIRPRRKATVFYDQATGKQKVYYDAKEYTITNLHRFAEYARWADPNDYPKAVSEPNMPPSIEKPVDPDSWSLEQKAIYLKLLMMLENEP
jgi:hypothetical protein